MSIYDQLVRVAPDGISLVPGLAESWDVSEDGLTYTFHLRPNVLFSDGTPMTSEDVLYSWVRAANDPEQHWTFTLTALSGTPTARSRASQLRTTRPSSSSWRSLGRHSSLTWPCSTCPSSPRRSPKDNEERLVEECMGTGPFALGEWQKGESLRLVKNTNYWEEDLPLLDEVDRLCGA